jgi:multidrug efflux pump subunit AcrA (membrane-fusion protein)
MIWLPKKGIILHSSKTNWNLANNKNFNMSNTEEIDHSSEAIRDYLEQIPNRILRWGNYILCGVLLALFAIAWFVEYPTIVYADFKLMATNTPKPIIAKVNGRLEQLFVVENQKVKPNQILGYIESTAKHKEVLALEQELSNLVLWLDSKDWKQLNQVRLKNYQNLGTLQMGYQEFQQLYIQTLVLFGEGYYMQKQKYLKGDLKELGNMSENLKNQKQIQTQDATLQEKEYQKNKTLYSKDIIANTDYSREESKVLAKKLPIKNTETALLNNTMLMRAKEKEILDLEKSALEQKERFRQSLNSLRSLIMAWKSNYILTAPTDGVVNFTGTLQEQQNLKANSILLYVTAQKNQYQGEIKIPQANFGKIKIGQTVLIKFQGYPFEEYGAVEGKIKSIAKIPTAETQTFYAIITLPNPPITTNNKTIAYRNGMTASASIITENLKLAQRLLYSFKKTTSR